MMIVGDAGSEGGGNPLEPGDVIALGHEIKLRAETWSMWSGTLLGLAMTVVFLTFYLTNGRPLVTEAGGTLAGGLGGFLVGRAIGRMLCYGSVGKLLDRRQIHFEAVPGHIDGAAGLRPIGAFYLGQAGLLAIPAVFLLVWTLIFLIPSWHDRYAAWQAPYLWLLAVAVAFELAGFVLPLWQVHLDMVAVKSRYLPEADELAAQIADVGKELELDLPGDRREAQRDRLSQMTSRYRDIEAMPTWPVDRSIKRWVTLTNVALIVPLVTQATALSGFS
jgi:hypothetical protein